MHIMNSTVQNRKGCEPEQKELLYMNNEKIYRAMSHGGVGGLVLGIVVLVTGIVTGTLMIINGAKVLRNKYQVTL